MSMMSYEDGSLRIVVHTGNLIESDWEDRTQGFRRKHFFQLSMP